MISSREPSLFGLFGSRRLLVSGISLAWLLAVSIAGCSRSEPTPPPPGPGPSAGNYSSTLGKLVWTSNQGTPSPAASASRIETFNIVMLDLADRSTRGLTADSWPVINHHPVFTPRADQIVWAHGRVGHTRIWKMKVDGTDKEAVTAPPSGEMDGHPWVGIDDRIYFVRHGHPSGVHRIFRISLDGSGETQLVGGADKDRFHPNLRNDRKTVVYTAGPAGSARGDEIRVFDQSQSEDKEFYKPGWPVSAAVWHPDGGRVVVAEDHDRDDRFRIVEVEYPSARPLGTLTDDAQDNTIPYYAYPSGAFIDWVRWPGGRRTRNIARMKADGSDQELLTNNAYEDTKIVGDIEIQPDGKCVPRPVGCYPTPPPCGQFLLPEDTLEDAEETGRAWAQKFASSGGAPVISPDGYLEFTRKGLAGMVGSAEIEVPPAVLIRVKRLSAQVGEAGTSLLRERIADFFVNTLLAELDSSGRRGE